jgi:hypothetical protein
MTNNELMNDRVGVIVKKMDVYLTIKENKCSKSIKLLVCITDAEKSQGL